MARNLSRHLNLFQAAKKLGITHGTIRGWIKKGAPYSRRHSSRGPKIYMVNDVELRAWLMKEASQGRIQSKLVRKYRPIKDLQKLIKQIKRNLGLTNKEIAEELQIKHSALNFYLYPQLYGVKQAPLILIAKAENLLETGFKHRHPWTPPSKTEVTKVLKLSGGIRDRARKLLHVDFSRLQELIIKYNLESLVKYPKSSLWRK